MQYLINDRSKIEQLCQASASGDLELVHKFLDSMSNCTPEDPEADTILEISDLNGLNSEGMSPIGCAVCNNRPEILDLFLKHPNSASHVDLTFCDPILGHTLLHSMSKR